MHIVRNKAEQSFIELIEAVHTSLYAQEEKQQIFLNMGYDLPLMQCLLRSVSPPGCLSFALQSRLHIHNYRFFCTVKVPIPKSASVSVVGCSPENVIVRKASPQASHTYAMGFKSGKNVSQSIRVISSLSSIC
ncbi:hypothetical protein TNCV_1392091 [Trichonephila clavipes]|nr:hypothetical protein TNCV_1392091 [Trichonephila clavipes]